MPQSVGVESSQREKSPVLDEIDLGAAGAPGTMEPTTWVSGTVSRMVATVSCSHTATIPRPMLKTRNISESETWPRAWMAVKMGGTLHEPRLNSAAKLSGRMEGTFPGSPPPVTWASPLSKGSTGSNKGW